MTPDEQKVHDWFCNYGSVHKVRADPRGKYWVSGYLEEITRMIVDQKAKAKEGVVGDVSGQNRPRDSELKGRAGETRKPKTRSPRKRSGGDRPANSGSGY